MLSWLFKKRGSAAAPAAATAVQRAARLAEPPHLQAEARQAAERAAKQEQRSAGKAKAADDARALWAPQLQAALGDDAALLQLALASPVLAIKQAAVEALAGEDALKQAERAFRSHDRKVHRIAKRRFEAAVAQREARATADALIDTATTLTKVEVVAANTLVALDRDWEALAAALLEPSQHTTFAALRDRLNTAVRERGEQQLALERAAADAARALAEAAEPAPPTPAPAPVDAVPLAELAAVATAETTAQTTPDSTPEAAAEPTQELAPEAPTAAPRRKPKALTTEQLQRLEARLQQAETALADGQSGVLQQHVKALDAMLGTFGEHAMSNTPRTLQERLHAVQAEAARLRGWQQWGGARARDDLAAEAEALARLACLATAAPVPDAIKLPLKAHGDAIHALRQRWKELDRSGAAAPQALWHRFDTALQTAYQPLAEQQALQKAAREDNLAAREALLAELEAWCADPLAEAASEPEVQDVSIQAVSTTAALVDTGSAPPLKDRLRALDRFHTAWRQLGPLEHTVPAAARSALAKRLERSVERVEAPLLQARRVAQAEREQLVVRAEALALAKSQPQGTQAQATQPPLRDAAQRVRELQAEWQQHARSLPLARGAEAALWTRFKAATDAVFAQREAVFNARDAEWAANLAARETLLQRLSAIGSDTPAADIRSTLAEVDRAWRQAGEVSRAAAASLEARLHEAHAAALRHLADSAQQRWRLHCDTLLARLMLCEERERLERAVAGDAPASGGDELAVRWAQQPTLAAPWGRALQERWERAPALAPAEPSQPPDPSFDALMLQLEAAFDLPTAAEHQAARRELKLRALKEALEGRRASAADPAVQRDEWLAAALRRAGTTPAQRERLHAFLAAWRALPQGHVDGPA